MTRDVERGSQPDDIHGLRDLVESLRARTLTIPADGHGGAADVLQWADDVAAVGWATVDLDRTVAALPGLRFETAPDEVCLGARALRARTGGIDLVLLEPSTEGRLAAFLARHGEGLAVHYWILPNAPAGGPPCPTALGRAGRLVPGARSWGPFDIVFDPA